MALPAARGVVIPGTQSSIPCGVGLFSDNLFREVIEATVCSDWITEFCTFFEALIVLRLMAIARSWGRLSRFKVSSFGPELEPLLAKRREFLRSILALCCQLLFLGLLLFDLAPIMHIPTLSFVIIGVALTVSHAGSLARTEREGLNSGESSHAPSIQVLKWTCLCISLSLALVIPFFKEATQGGRVMFLIHAIIFVGLAVAKFATNRRRYLFSVGLDVFRAFHAGLLACEVLPWTWFYVAGLIFTFDVLEALFFTVVTEDMPTGFAAKDSLPLMDKLNHHSQNDNEHVQCADYERPDTLVGLAFGENVGRKALLNSGGTLFGLLTGFSIVLIIALQTCDRIVAPFSDPSLVCPSGPTAIKMEWQLVLCLVVGPFFAARLSIRRLWSIVTEDGSRAVSFSFPKLALYGCFSLALQDTVLINSDQKDPFGLFETRLCVTDIFIVLMALALAADGVVDCGPLRVSAVILKQLLYALMFPFAFVLATLIQLKLFGDNPDEHPKRHGVASYSLMAKLTWAVFLCIGRDAFRLWSEGYQIH